MRILLVEDDEILVNLLTKSLNARNYSIDTVGDGIQAWEYLSSIDYDLIIMDVLLPNLDGVSLCRRLRADQNDTPILILTAQNHSQAKVRGLDAGADDYLAKPFDIEELLARIRALLRRRGGDLFPVLQCGGLLLDPAQCSASYEGIPLPLSTKEYALLELFLHNPQHVFSIPEILDSLWSSDEYPAEATVRSHIRRLRTRLIETGAPKDIIANVHGRGYFLKVEDHHAVPADQPEVIDERQFTLQRQATSSAEQQYQSFLAETWQQFRPKAETYLATIQTLLQQIQQGRITSAEAEEAHLLSHRLAGTIGLFHQDAAMQSAQRLEAYFEALAQVLPAPTDEGRSQFESTPTYLTQTERKHHLGIIQKALAQLSSPHSNPSLSRVVLLNVDTDLTQSIHEANQAGSLDLQSIETLNDFPSVDRSNSPGGLLIPLNAELSALTNLAPELEQLKQAHPELVIIAVGSPITFETRLQATRLGVDYILEHHHSPQTLLKQVIQLLYPQANQTRALLIDDDETWLQVMTQRLETFGFEVTASAHPEAFWDSLEECQPDLLVLDLKMPQVSGLELCKVVRSHPDWQALPVVFVSTVTDCSTQISSIAAGADEFISKQLDLDVIVRRILHRLTRFADGKKTQPKQSWANSSLL